ncbi:MAG: hypothetical protein AAB610_01000 [Patescibacteria group bacterium]
MEKFDEKIDSRQILERFYMLFSDKEEITLEDLSKLKEQGITTENFLDYLSEKYNFLFHGSRNNLSFSEQITSQGRGVLFASSDPAIAILKAIYLNNAKNLSYPMNVIDNRSNLVLTIEGPEEDTIGDTGYVYLIENSEEFEKDANSNWQYSKKDQDGKGTKFVKKIQIEKSDFLYPVNII